MAGAAAAAVLILIVALLLLRTAPAPAPAAASDHATPPGDIPVQQTVIRVAPEKADLEKARAYARAHPEDLSGRYKQFNDIVWKWDGTEVAADAAKEAAAVKSALLDQVKVWMAEAEAKVQELVDRADSRGAAQRLEELKPSHQTPEWNLAVEKRISDLYIEARRKADAGKPEEPGRPGANPDKPADKGLSEEAKAYPSKFKAILDRASIRDFAGAIADLERLVAVMKDDDARREAAHDADDLRGMATVAKSSLDAMKKKPRGSGLTVLVRQDSGGSKRYSGLILQIDAERVEIHSGKTSTFVEWPDVSLVTLAETARPGKADRRLLSALCLLDGATDEAKSYEADPGPRWWAYGAVQPPPMPKPEPAEKGARELYYSAERGYRSMETRAAAIEQYRSLRTDFASTSIAKVYAERLARRSESGKEYTFAPANFHAEGTFRLSKAGKLESVKDSDEPDTLRNVAEIEFAALPGTAYRCWVWLGACCDETFYCYLQGSELTDTDPKTRKKIACEPGTSAASAFKPPVRNLKKTHEEHKVKGAKTHPKTASRWEWVEIPLPKYASAGGKKLRIMTNQAGFSIGGAVVSSTRKAPPTEAELKDVDKDRETPDASAPDPDLLAWWTFDEGAGADVADATGKGHNGRLNGKIEWVDGKFGGALRFSGGTDGVVIPDAEDLRLPDDLTVAFWFRKDADTGDWACLFGKGKGQSRNYGVWLETKTGQILFQEYGAAALNMKTVEGYAVGPWRHLACVVSGSRAIIYVDGEKKAEDQRKGAAETPAHPVGIGWASEHSAFVGALDDVRLYRRALTPEEVKALSDMGR